MAITEAARNDFYNGLLEVLGPANTETLMSAIPLHDSEEVATKGDMSQLKANSLPTSPPRSGHSAPS